jgi:hypothetical protein
VLSRRARADGARAGETSSAAGSGGGIPGSSRAIRLRLETKRSRPLEVRSGGRSPQRAETLIGKQVLQGIAG